jgi:hypothetical protein
MIEGRIVFVTFELFPITAGGIGRAIYNMVKTVSAEDRHRISIVLVSDLKPGSRVPFELNGIDIVFADINDEHGLTCDEATNPPRWAFDNTEWHWRSFVALRALRELNSRQKISYVEFTDWGGLGYCTVEQKKAGLDFHDVVVSIRLHGPHGVLLNTDRYAVTDHDLNIFDIERKALRDCDLVIAQTRPYFDVVGRVFDFDLIEWEKRYVYSPLPVITDSKPETGWRTGHCNKRVVFTSKFQHVKRPELFVRGASKFVYAQEGSDWGVTFCAHITDPASKQKVVHQIATALVDRFEFRDFQGAERDHFIAHSIVVISSSCESFCLAAYEASLLGAAVVLNGMNPSFGDGTLWEDGVNCYKFNGSAGDLATVLEKVASSKSVLQQVHIPEFVPPWVLQQHSTLMKSVESREKQNSHVSVLIYDVTTAEKLSRTLKNVSAFNTVDLELIVTLGSNIDDKLRLLENEIVAANDSQIKVVADPTERSPGALIKLGLKIATGDYVAVVRCGDLLHDSFVERAKSALNNDLGIDCVTCHTGYFNGSEPLPRTDRAWILSKYHVSVGEPRLSGFLTNRGGNGPLMVRRNLPLEDYFDEEVDAEVVWAFWHALQSEGRNTVTLNAVYAFCDSESQTSHAHRSDHWESTLEHHEMLQRYAPSVLKRGSYFLLDCVRKASEARSANSTGEFALGASMENEAVNLAAFHHLIDSVGVSTPDVTARPWWARLTRSSNRKTREYDFLRNSRAFDTEWYLQQYPDVASAKMNPLRHYLEFGASEGRLPNPFFNGELYMRANPDVRSAGLNPLFHYLKYGRSEGRRLK